MDDLLQQLGILLTGPSAGFQLQVEGWGQGLPHHFQPRNAGGKIYTIRAPLPAQHFHTNNYTQSALVHATHTDVYRSIQRWNSCSDHSPMNVLGSARSPGPCLMLL